MLSWQFNKTFGSIYLHHRESMGDFDLHTYGCEEEIFGLSH